MVVMMILSKIQGYALRRDAAFCNNTSSGVRVRAVCVEELIGLTAAEPVPVQPPHKN